MPNENELSNREQEILRLVATGASNKEIAQKLVISPNTVKVHLRKIFSKINVVSRTEAALYAMRVGLVKEIRVAEAVTTGDPDSIANGSDGAQEADFSIETTNGLRSGIRTWGIIAVFGIVIVIIFAFVATRLFTGSPPIPSPANASSIQRWATKASLPEPRAGMASAVYENNIYLIAGETDQGINGTVERYNPNSDSWQNLAQKPIPVTDIQAVVIGEKIYVPGGRKTDGNPTNVLEIFDPRQDRWTTGAQLPASLSGYALAASEGRLYLFGGWDGTRAVSDVFMYDPFSDTWQSRSPLPTARAYAVAVVAESKIFLIGGFDGIDSLSSVTVYFPQRDQNDGSAWEDRAPLPSGRYAMAGALLADRIYIIGGKGPGDLSPLQYILADNHWVTFDSPKNSTATNPVLLPLDTQLHLLGGKDENIMISLHQTYQAIYTILLPQTQK